MSRAFWISRDVEKHMEKRFYVISREKIRCDEQGNFYGVENLCPEEFENLTGIKLKPGQQKKFKLVQQGR